MRDIILSCLEIDPNDRPTAMLLVELLQQAPVMPAAKSAIKLGRLSSLASSVAAATATGLQHRPSPPPHPAMLPGMAHLEDAGSKRGPRPMPPVQGLAQPQRGPSPQDQQQQEEEEEKQEEGQEPQQEEVEEQQQEQQRLPQQQKQQHKQASSRRPRPQAAREQQQPPVPPPPPPLQHPAPLWPALQPPRQGSQLSSPFHAVELQPLGSGSLGSPLQWVGAGALGCSSAEHGERPVTGKSSPGRQASLAPSPG